MTLPHREEAERILAWTEGDALAALRLVEGQFNILYTRAQVLVGLAGVVVTVTGFSGRLIAGTALAAQVLVIAGLATVLTAAVFLFTRVMRIRWLTAERDIETPDGLARVLARRDARSRAYVLGGAVLCAGLLLYCCAVAIMLLNPAPLAVPVR